MQGGDSDSPGTGESYYHSSVGSQYPCSGTQVPSTGTNTAVDAPRLHRIWGFGVAGCSSTPDVGSLHPIVEVAGCPSILYVGSLHPIVGVAGCPSTPDVGPPANQRPLDRSQSAFGDYRPNMDAVNNLVIDTPTLSAPPPKTIVDFDSLTFEQMGISPAR